MSWTADSSRSEIQNAALFEGLPPETLKLVMSRASRAALPRGAFLFQQGEPATKLFLLDSGRLRLFEVSADNRELLVRFVRPGEVTGDRAALPGADYRASALSDTPVRTYAWTTGAIVALLEEVPRLAKNLVAITTKYLHYSRERHLLLATASADHRIRWAVRELARFNGYSQGNTTVITGRSLQRDIADLAATTIYTVSRVLGGYEGRGLLTTARGRIILSPSFE